MRRTGKALISDWRSNIKVFEGIPRPSPMLGHDQPPVAGKHDHISERKADLSQKEYPIHSKLCIITESLIEIYSRQDDDLVIFIASRILSRLISTGP